ncbi:uncharacterized protein LOC135681047 isoform X2 [Rhopilema esculentum]|uniref:uncharacterized protein LOC135681047 isoform X2 n=1 Tax=Rhopilema esculentum TaxID=499914 RepID=UPI0031E2A81C|eukprot:gene13121-3910_t
MEEALFLDEILEKVFVYFNAKSLTNLSLVCKQWLRVSRAPELWKKLVLRKWPSQRFLYQNINARSMEWHLAYQELEQKSWFSPDDMKYFIFCKTLADEPMLEELRNVMFERMSYVSEKWLQAYPYEHDDSNYRFDKNAELYFDTTQLRWVFLDRRRGYIGDLFPSQKLKMLRRNKKTRHIRPYQVIPSCLVLYRWLCLFSSFAAAEDGLTFYRIWRFRLKHRDTGLIFEIYDWKAAMNTTFSNGMPGNKSFREDALELLNILTHPHFIMHPLGLQPVLNKFNLYFASASAGGTSRSCFQKEQTPRKKRRLRCKSPINRDTGSQDMEKFKAISDASDNDDDGQCRERRYPKRKRSPKPHLPLSPVSPVAGSTQPSVFENKVFSRESSCSSVLSDTEDSERSERESDFDSECEFPEHGYAVNCDYFIIGAHSLDIEEQHSIQASISDGWMVTRRARPCNTQVFYNPMEGFWFIANENNAEVHPESPFVPMKDRQVVSPSLVTHVHCRSNSDIGIQSYPKAGNFLEKHNRSNSSLSVTPLLPENKALADQLLSPPLSPLFCLSWSQNSVASIGTSISSKSHAMTDDDFSQPVEALPSCLALYRLICLFDLNCSMYKSSDDVSAWSVKMLHKKTGGVVCFKDYNEFPLVHQKDESGGESEDDEATSTTASSQSYRDLSFDAAEFKAAVIQILNLLMDEKFSHPYGTVAGSVA